MIAAIYARKSKKKEDVAEDSQMVPLQIANARAFAHSKGWTVNERFIFEDDGKSGAEFERRPGFQQMMNALIPKAPFQVLIVSEQKSVGREMSETGYIIKQLDEAGVKVWSYHDNKCITPANALEQMVSRFDGFADQQHIEKDSKRMHESLTHHSKAGHAVGGRVFGYSNEPVYNGTDRDGHPLYSHKVRVIKPDEAAVVRRIFELYAEGYGFKRLARQLNQEHVPEPLHFRRADGLELVKGWAPTTVRDVLRRTTYRGEVIWNKTKKKNAWWAYAPTKRPESEWVRTTVKDLRIIDDALWDRVQARLAAVAGQHLRFASGRISGRPPKHAPQNLLAGLATCGVCGGGLIGEAGGHKRGRRPEYICNRRRHHASGCTNMLKMPATEMHEAVLREVEEHVLTPKAIEQVVALTDRDDVRDQQKALQIERKDVERRIARFEHRHRDGRHGLEVPGGAVTGPGNATYANRW